MLSKNVDEIIYQTNGLQRWNVKSKLLLAKRKQPNQPTHKPTSNSYRVLHQHANQNQTKIQRGNEEP